MLLDVITQVTQTKNKFKGLPLGARAVQIADGNVGNYFLTTFGRATRETVCSCEVKMEPSLSQALHLINGDIVQSRIQSGGLTGELLEEHPPAEVLRQLYLRTLCPHRTTSRRPSSANSTRNRTKRPAWTMSSGLCSTQRNSFLPIDGEIQN